MTELKIHKWKSRNLLDGTGPYLTLWNNGKKESLDEIAEYNDGELFKEIILKKGILRTTHNSKLDIILEKGTDRTDTLNTSKMFWGSPFTYLCTKYGGDRKVIMVYEFEKISQTTEEERIQPNIEEEFRIRGYQHIYKFLTEPLDALWTIIEIKPENLINNSNK